MPRTHNSPVIQPTQTDISMEKESMSEKKPFSLTFIRTTAIIVCLMLLSGWGGWFIGRYDPKSPADILSAIRQEVIPQTPQTIDRNQPINKNVDMSLFWKTWDTLEADYLFKDKINYQKMVYGAIKGMTAALEDPYTSFFPPQDNQTSKENLNGSFEGVGIQLGYKYGDQLVVMAPLSGLPAERAGVRAGDLIIKITDEAKGIDKDTYGMSLNDAVQIIRGEKGTKVKLKLLHDGESEPYEVELVRETVIVPSVEVSIGQVIDGTFTTEATASSKKVAHLKLSRFGELTDEQWDKSIEEILNHKDEIGGIVLDVRNNPGGYMQGAVNLAGEFLPVGKVVVKQESSKESPRSFTVQRYGRLLTMPMVVLINKGSASASEILAGALRDHSRAKLVGETSFGKGTIQEVEDFPGGAGVHITIAKWLTPNDTWVHDKGLEPDVTVEPDKDNPANDVQLNKAADLVLSNQ